MLNRILGDSPVRVVIKLILASLIVGMAMSAFGWYPIDVWYALQDSVAYIWSLGFDALDSFVGYILLGAAIVIPAYIVIRLLSYRRS